MSEFTIITKGIAASYLKKDAAQNDVWKVLFPVNDCHNLKLRVGRDDENTDHDSGIVLGQMGVRIDISVTNPLTATATKGGDYDDFLDLTGAGLHSALKTKFPLDEMKAVLMSIENAEFSAEDHHPDAFKFVNGNGVDVTAPFQPIGNCGKAVVEGGELTLRVTGLGSGNFSMVFSEDTVITFDNDCYKATTKTAGDLEMLYDILRDAEDPGKKFSLKNMTFLSQRAVVGVGANGGGPNVNTVTTTNVTSAAPENSFEGLPCNKFRISVPRTLPS